MLRAYKTEKESGYLPDDAKILFATISERAQERLGGFDYNPKQVIRQERGWAGHFICSSKCLFRRNTLLSFPHTDTHVVISTVGLQEAAYPPGHKYYTGPFEKISANHYFETKAFSALKGDGQYHNADTMEPVYFSSPWFITKWDNEAIHANEMHETVVNEITERFLSGTLYPTLCSVGDEPTQDYKAGIDEAFNKKSEDGKGTE